MQTSELQLTAYHEAGHAVMAHLRKTVVFHATVKQQGESHGHFRCESVPDKLSPNCEPAHRQMVIARIEILLAGAAAEARRLSLTDGCDDVATDVANFERTATGQWDLTEARRLSRAISFTREEALHQVHFLHMRAVGRFASNVRIWAAVETVAMALAAHEEIDGTHVHWLVCKALNGINYWKLGQELSERIKGGPSQALLLGLSKTAEKFST